MNDSLFTVPCYRCGKPLLSNVSEAALACVRGCEPDDRLGKLLALIKAGLAKHGYYGQSHRSLRIKFGDGFEPTLAKCRKLALVKSSGRGRNRAHRLTELGFRMLRSIERAAGVKS